MPWSVKKMNDKFCVVKEGETSAISGGCHDSKSEAAGHLRALYASEAEHAVSGLYEDEELEELAENDEDLSGDSYVFSDSMTEHAWEGPIVFENVFTGDNRIFKDQSINWQEDTLPWAFRWQKASGQGHIGSVPVGRVDRIERKEDGSIWGYGVIIPELSSEAEEYYKLIKSGAGGGVSVDGDSAQFEIQEQDKGTPKVEFSSMRLRALSAVDIPAFNGARIRLVGQPASEPPVEMGKEAEEESAPDTVDSLTLQEETTDEVIQENASNENSITDIREELARKKEKKAKKGMNYGWQVDNTLTAAAIPTIPSTDSFIDPVFEGPTALTVTPDGKVFGHLALFNTCHIGFPGTCVKPPKGSKYQYFHTGQIETAEGDLVEVGHLTFKTGHAAMAASPRIAAEHYDNTGAVAADVRAGEDKFGIWVVGALRPGLSDEDIRAFRSAPLSGDWRRIGNKLELVGALSVNVPGFPVPRVKALVASGETETLFTFLQDDDEEFIPSNYELSLRADKKFDLAAKVQEFLGEDSDITLPEGKIEEDVPEVPSKKELKDRAEHYTKNQLFADLKAIRELLDDKDVTMSKKVREAAEQLYNAYIKVEDGKRSTYSGLDLDIIDASGLEIEEWEAQLEFSGLSVQEFYNQCHDEHGQFCPGSDGPGRIRDNVKGQHPGPRGEAHGTGGKSAEEHQAEHDAYNASKGKAPRTQQSNSGNNSGNNTNNNNNNNGQGGGVNPRTYENFRITRRRATGWAALASLAAATLYSPASGVLAGIAQAGGVAIIANPAVLTLAVVTGISYAGKNAFAARKHRIEYNRQVDRKLKRDKLNQRQQRERERLDVTT